MENCVLLSKLDNSTKEWYIESDECDILSALIIGKELITSNYYKTNKEKIVNDMRIKLEDFETTIDSLKNEFKNERELLENEYNRKLNIEKSKNEELNNKFNIDNRDSINIAVSHALKYAENNIELLKKSNEKLTEDLNNCIKIKEEYENFKCNINKSKIKGELTEIEVKKYIENAGFLTKKPGINSGDLFVYTTNNELICVLEIKNYGDDNKNKLGPNGSEVYKMYKDIETQLNSENKINVPWLFISLGCEIPNMCELRDSHVGVNCIYLSEPSYKEMIECIKCCIIINKINNSGDNELYMQTKIDEIYDIFMKFSKSSPNFKRIKTSLNKSIKDIEKEEEKYNKYLEDNMSRVDKIFKDIKNVPTNIKNIDYNINIDTLSYKEIGEYMIKLKDYCKMLEYNKIRNS